MVLGVADAPSTNYRPARLSDRDQPPEISQFPPAIRRRSLPNRVLASFRPRRGPIRRAPGALGLRRDRPRASAPAARPRALHRCLAPPGRVGAGPALRLLTPYLRFRACGATWTF